MLSFLFPRVCGVCGKKINQNFACEKCSNILKYTLKKELCVRKFENPIDILICLFSYRGVIRQKILSFKFYEKPYIGYVFAELMAEVMKKMAIAIDAVIPVPVHRKRYKERGYNQSAILAKKIAMKMQIKCWGNVLYKKHHTVPQSTLNEKNRKENVKNVYGVRHSNKIKDKIILLVDDIYTTGATAKECARILKQNGVSQVIVMTIAYSTHALLCG